MSNRATSLMRPGLAAGLLLLILWLAGSSRAANIPTLTIPELIPAQPGQTVTVPVVFDNGGVDNVNTFLFDIRYDTSLLALNPTDSNSDGVPDSIVVDVPTGFVATIDLSSGGGIGSILVTIVNLSSPLAGMPNLTLLEMTFTAGTPVNPAITDLTFATSPAPFFADKNGLTISGIFDGGSVAIGEVNLPTATATGQPTATPTSKPPTATPRPATATPRPPTATPGPFCGELIVNGGMENNSGWLINANAFPASYVSGIAHTGNRSMRIGIVNPWDNRFSYSSVQQTLQVPSSAATTTLRFWLLPTTTGRQAEKIKPPDFVPTEHSDGTLGPLADDVQMVLLFDQAGTQHVLLFQRQNFGGWAPYEMDLRAYRGQRITIYFGVFNNGTGGITGMYLDDVSMQYCN